MLFNVGLQITYNRNIYKAYMCIIIELTFIRKIQNDIVTKKYK